MPFTFTLPSDPSKEVRLREATVADAVEFSGVDQAWEEEATTIFLSRIQEKETYSDPREWTGEDRRFALFQYYLNTTQIPNIALTFTYDGLEQTHDVPLTQILSTYKPLDGKPERDFAFNGRNIVVSPLRGADLELFEKRFAEINAIEESLDGQKDTLDPGRAKALQSDLRIRKAKLFLSRICAYMDIPSLDEKGTRATRRPAVEKFVEALSPTEFGEMAERIGDCLTEMRHGLLSEYRNGHVELVIPGIHPDNAEEGETISLHYPFRFVGVIPTVL